MSSLNKQSILSKLREGVAGRIVSGSFWVILGTIASKVLVFAATMIVARILAKDVYGQLGIVRSTIQLFVSLSAFGVGAMATKYIAQYRKSSKIETAKIYCIANIFVLCMAVISCTVLILTADTIAINRLKTPELATDIRIAGVILFFTLLNGAQTGSLSGFEDFRRISFSNMVMGVSEVVLLCGGAYLWGLHGAVMGFGITYLIAFLYNGYYIRKHLREEQIDYIEGLKALKLADFRILLSFSIPLAATSWVQASVYWWMKTVVVNYAGFADMANYDVGEQWKIQIMFIPAILSTVLLPILSSVNDNETDRKKAIRINYYINVTTTLSLSLLIVLFGSLILKLYGPSYNNPLPLYILACTTVFDSISNVYGTALISANKVPLTLISNIIWAIVLLICFYSIVRIQWPFENKLAISYLFAGAFQALTVSVIAKKSKVC